MQVMVILKYMLRKLPPDKFFIKGFSKIKMDIIYTFMFNRVGVGQFYPKDIVIQSQHLEAAFFIFTKKNIYNH